jgi:hypothetical protein
MQTDVSVRAPLVSHRPDKAFETHPLPPPREAAANRSSHDFAGGVSNRRKSTATAGIISVRPVPSQSFGRRGEDAVVCTILSRLVGLLGYRANQAQQLALVVTDHCKAVSTTLTSTTSVFTGSSWTVHAHTCFSLAPVNRDWPLKRARGSAELPQCITAPGGILYNTSCLRWAQVFQNIGELVGCWGVLYYVCGSS